MRQRYYNPVSYVDPFGLSPILEQEAGNNTIHKILAIAGFLPVVGGVADALDVMLYLAEGDKEGALTAIMAMACGGVASVVIARSVSTITRAAKTLSNVAELPKSASLVRKAANTFSNSGSFMKVASNGADAAQTLKAVKQGRVVDKLKDAKKILISTADDSWEFGHLASKTSLNKRQVKLLETLHTPGATTIVHKKMVSMNDLRQLTNVTGDEFNMFTNGSRRLIIRGKGNQITVSKEMYDDIINGVYGKFSGHTHPGFSLNPGPADEPFLKKIGQKRSSIWGNTGEGWSPFGQDKWLTEEVQMQIRREKMAKIYGN